MLSNLIGGSVGLSHLVRETACITTVTLALLESIADTTAGATRRSITSSAIVREAASITTVTLTTLESIAHASGLALISTVETTVICASHIVGEAASITTVALTC